MVQKNVDTTDTAEAERARATTEARARLLRLAAEQGVKPIQSIDDLRGDFWPEEESTEEFLAWLRATRLNGAGVAWGATPACYAGVRFTISSNYVTLLKRNLLTRPR